MKRTRNSRLLLALCAALCATGCVVNPVTGGSELRLVGSGEEVVLGHQTHPNVVFMYDGEYHDPELNRYLGTIVMRLHRGSHRPDMGMEFTMLNTSVVNAFATPGHVYATRGFLARLENEAQFAAVMGHELAHVAAGHSAKQLTHSVLVSLALGVADYAGGDSLAAGLASGIGEAGVALLGLSYSREQERQADRVGTYYMALAGWEPRQAVRMQELLDSLSDSKETVLDKYLSTHPGRDSRVGEIRGVIEEKHLSRRYVQGDGVFASRWERRLAELKQVDRAFEPYDRGMKALKKGRHREALEAADEALRALADQAPLHRLRGDALVELKRYDDAEQAYRRSLRVDPRYVPGNIGLGNVYAKTGRSGEAEEQFRIAARGWPGVAVSGQSLRRAGSERGD
jgi:predicted Zn-dependent protease